MTDWQKIKKLLFEVRKVAVNIPATNSDCNYSYAEYLETLDILGFYVEKNYCDGAKNMCRDCDIHLLAIQGDIGNSDIIESLDKVREKLYEVEKLLDGEGDKKSKK